MPYNFATIYTDKSICLYIGNYMNKMCKICKVEKSAGLFYTRHSSCIVCWNSSRREQNKKSECRHCHVKFRPDVQGRYKFCSEKCRFLGKVKVDDANGCWIWTGHIQSKRGGYGTFVPAGKKSGLAHRSSYRLFKGNLDDKNLVLHSCHNPICVAPDHLRQGTPMDNTLDRKNAGRIKYPLKN